MLHDHLRSHTAVSAHGQRILILPYLDLIEPAVRLLRLRPLQKPIQRMIGICHNRHIHHNVTGDGCRVHIDMYNLRIRGKFIQIPCNTIIKAGSYGKKHIALADRHIGSVFSMHTAVADIQCMGSRNGAFSHDGGYNRHILLLHKLQQLVVGPCNVDAATGQNQRLFGGLQKLICALQLPHMNTGVGLISANFHLVRIIRRS